MKAFYVGLIIMIVGWGISFLIANYFGLELGIFVGVGIGGVGGCLSGLGLAYRKPRDRWWGSLS